MGTDHTYRYVNATNVYNKGKADVGMTKGTVSGSVAANTSKTISTGLSSIAKLFVYYQIPELATIAGEKYRHDLMYYSTHLPTSGYVVVGGADPLIGQYQTAYGAALNTAVADSGHRPILVSISGGNFTIKTRSKYISNIIWYASNS